MASLYRAWASIGALIGVNIAIALLAINVNGNFLIGNVLAEAVFVLAIISLLVDLNLIPHRLENRFVIVGFIAFIAGFLIEGLLFSSLFIKDNMIAIMTEWLAIAPIMIFLVGVPALSIGRLVSKERKIFGLDSTGFNGTMFVLAFTILYAIVAMWALINFGVLKI